MLGMLHNKAVYRAFCGIYISPIILRKRELFNPTKGSGAVVLLNTWGYSEKKENKKKERKKHEELLDISYIKSDYGFHIAVTWGFPFPDGGARNSRDNKGIKELLRPSRLPQGVHHEGQKGVWSPDVRIYFLACQFCLRDAKKGRVGSCPPLTDSLRNKTKTENPSFQV